MTKQDFKQQPPSFVGVVKVAFNYNYATFVPMGEPRIVPVTQHSVLGLEADVLKQAIVDVLRFRGEGRLALGHIVVTETEAPVGSASMIEFVAWALRLASRNPRGRTHVLCVNFEPGFRI
jgi:hypothetical protein